jgi:subtilisin family serine protease
VIIADTGVAADLPPILTPGTPGDPNNPIVFGETDEPDADTPPDGYLDPVAGHGTFIAGLIQQLAPGCMQLHVRLMTRFGIVVEWSVGALLQWVPTVATAIDRDVIVSMSFGGPTLGQPVFLEDLTAAAAAAAGTAPDGSTTGVALVAAAGNDGTCIPYFPAAWPTVVGVGGVGPDGPPDWTNYGAWVDACAPAADLVSCFFEFNGALPSINTVDEDDFPGWAYWSGTSFAVPCVVAALARSIAVEGLNAPDAVEQTIRGAHLARIVGLGTVVNV